MLGMITVTGMVAAAIETANRASFYGIYGNANGCGLACRMACDAVRDHLEASGIAWNSFLIKEAKTVDTSGTKTPYCAEIIFEVD